MNPFEYLNDIILVCLRVLDLDEWYDADGLSKSQIKWLWLMKAELGCRVKCRPISVVRKVKLFLRMFEENRADLLRTYVKILDDNYELILDDNDELWVDECPLGDILTLDVRGHHKLQSEIDKIMNETIEKWEVYER